MLVVAVGTVHVLVRFVELGRGFVDLFFRGVADLADGHVVEERHSRERVVRVDHDEVLTDLDHAHRNLVAVGRLGDELVAHGDALRIGELGAIELEDEVLVVLAVRLLGRDDDVADVARVQTGERRFEPGNEHAVAVHVTNGLAVFGGARFEHVALFVAKLVIDRDEGVRLDGRLAHAMGEVAR